MQSYDPRQHFMLDPILRMLRMFLVENGYFGDPSANSLHKLLVVAFRDFKTFQREKGVTCSQTKFVPNFVTHLH